MGEDDSSDRWILEGNETAVPKIKSKLVDITSQHFRIGWQKSPDNRAMGDSVVRYYPVSVAHDRIEALAKLNLFLEQVSPIIEIRPERMARTEGGLYCFVQIIDSPKAMKEIDFSRIGRNIIKDRRLCERQVGNIIDYLNTIYHFR